ncbi:MAG: hypothetical protein Q7R98_01050 [Candidatus Jorgensenbacteria bacterium]|nr:hypothetical protein [Candidatus Jorgensenbacteria bacterium]
MKKTIIMITIVLTLLPGLVGAMTREEILMKINEIMIQIQMIQAQIRAIEASLQIQAPEAGPVQSQSTSTKVIPETKSRDCNNPVFNENVRNECMYPHRRGVPYAES